MKYYVENADYTQNKPILYSEKTLIEYAMKLYTEYSKQGEYDWLLEKYPEKNKLSVVSICLDFLNDRFSDNDTPFKECEIYDDDMEDLKVVTSTPIPNCIIITLSNGTQILKSYDYEKIKIAVYDITDDVKSQTKIAVYSLPKFIEEINLAPEFMDFDLENVRFEIEKE